MTTSELLTHDFTAKELSEFDGTDFIIAVWKEKGIAIVEYIKTLNVTPQPMENFLSFCTPCGGNWGGMLLSGLKELYPTIWELIPENMGVFGFGALCDVISLLGYFKEGA
jgi:hypothetical protein